MATLKVSTQVLKDTSSKVRECNEKLDEALQEINNKMQSLEASWKSDAASDIRAAMNALKPRFVEYKEVISSYAKFLNDTADTYEQLETTVQNNANSFKQ